MFSLGNMLKYILVLILVVALIEARPGKKSGRGDGKPRNRGKGSESGSGSGSGSGSESYESSPREPLAASDFHDELQTVKDTAVAMSGAIHNVKELAEKALADPEGNGWEEFGAAMEHTFSEVGKRFDEELHRVSKLAEALWFDKNDLVKDDKCGFVAHVDKQKEDLDNVELAWALAMIQDLACMAGEFSQAENIPFELLQGSLHEDDAIQVVQSVIWEMHKISRAGDQFGSSMKNIADFLGIDSESKESGSDESGSYESSTMGQRGSTGGNERSTASNERTTDRNERSTAFNERTTASNERSTASNERTTDSNERSTTSNERSTASNERTTDSNARSTASNERSTASNERTTASNERSTQSREAPTTQQSADKRTLDRLMRFLKKFSN